MKMERFNAVVGENTMAHGDEWDFNAIPTGNRVNALQVACILANISGVDRVQGCYTRQNPAAMNNGPFTSMA